MMINIYKKIYDLFFEINFMFILCAYIAMDLYYAPNKINKFALENDKIKKDKSCDEYVNNKLDNMINIDDNWKNMLNMSYMYYVIYVPYISVQYVVAYNIKNPYRENSNFRTR